ncbi:hypothetical protein JNB63_02135 [Microbacterium trichothecenolyticum]|uniref:phage tail tube protein n=1 Tax=Microbacterium trichothecenolyticum TaxID=69370 RepID=UPI001C6E8EC5|nr:phage tail tube protein [Microbacterium trichothecenolyticum]MBW9118885.1 hypothetical protein [Microbacterium trichothecenolyticum]
MTIQADCSIGFKKETAYGTAVTVDRFLEFTSESLDYEREYYQGEGLRPGSRLARSARRVLAKDGAAGDIELEVPTRGLGTLLELLTGTASSTIVSGALYQQLFTLQKSDYLPSATIQKGIPRLGADTVDAYTFKGAQNTSFELSMANAEVLKLKTSWTAREVDTSIVYATPSYPSGFELFSFASAALVIGGSVTVPTATTLATGGTEVANVRDFSISVDQGLDDNGWNLGGAGKRSRRGAVGQAAVTGKVTAEYDSTTFRDAVRDQTPLALVATFLGATDISSGNKPTLQVVVPDIRFEGELPKSNGGDVITQSIDFTGFDGLVAAHALYIATRTADTAL